jgi:hypothetical protein
MSYSEKYLKYKSKFLKLRSIVGGGEDDEVWIMISTGTNWQVVKARDYQRKALNDYIDNNATGKKEYKPFEGVTFYIQKTDSSSSFNLYDFIREDGSVSIISRDKDSLDKLLGETMSRRDRIVDE